MSQNILKIIYYSHFHSVMTYGLLFWRHSPDSVRIFRLQKKSMIQIRFMLGCRSRDSCRKLFMKLKILLLFQYILSFLFVIKNKKRYTVYLLSMWCTIHHIDKRQHLNLHQPLPNITKTISTSARDCILSTEFMESEMK
jgi:hypothetical protein